MTAKPTIERFDPNVRPQRAVQTERAYRVLMREKILALLQVMNPADQIHYGAMNYPELVEYVRDWLQTEVEEVCDSPLSGLKTTDPAPLTL